VVSVLPQGNSTQSREDATSQRKLRQIPADHFTLYFKELAARERHTYDILPRFDGNANKKLKYWFLDNFSGMRI
jgi:hypothetical protein